MIVTHINFGGPADRAGIREGDNLTQVDSRLVNLGGDVILKIDNTSIASKDDFYLYFRNKEIGNSVTLTILREGNVINIPVVVDRLVYESSKRYKDPSNVNFSGYTTLNITQFTTTFTPHEGQLGLTIQYPSSWKVESLHNNIRFRSMPENSSDMRVYVDLIVRKTFYPNIDEEVAVGGTRNLSLLKSRRLLFWVITIHAG